MEDQHILTKDKATHDLIFRVPSVCLTPKYIQGKAEKVAQIMRKGNYDPDLSGIKTEELFAVLYGLENISIGLRSEIEQRHQVRPGIFKNEDISAYKNLPVSIEVGKDIVRIFTPYTFTRGMRESFQLAHYVRAALKEYEELQGNLYGHLKPPLYAVVKRKVLRFKGLERDNDNVETHDILNKVFESLGITDNPSQVVFYASAAETVSSKEDVGMEFMIFEASSFGKHLDDFPCYDNPSI